MSLKPIAFTLVFLLLMFTLPAMTAIATSSSGTINENDLTSSSWWNSNWPYRTPITISGSHPENYQLRIVLDKVDNLNNHCLDNFQDLRFIENETTGELAYWVENYISGGNAIFWVKRVENSDSTIYVYYGNASAGSVENGEATFEFFDHFSGTSLDGDKWTVSSGNPVVADSYVKLTNDIITTIDNYGVNNSARMKVYPITQGAGANTWGWSDASANITAFQDYTTGRTLSYESATESQSWTENLDEIIYDVHRNSTANVLFVEAGTLKNTHSTQVPTDNLNGRLANDSTTELWSDWFLIRRYISPEPTASVGAEETTASWHLIETWTGTVSAPAQWNHIETWTGTVSASIAPAQWRLIETWTGTVNAPASWNLIETWAGTVQTTGYVWDLIETWTAIVKAPAEWSLIETWSGTVNAPTQWNLIETWTGTVTASAQWSLIESWTGLVQVPAAWQLIENWIGTVEASVPPILAWQLIETWTGTVVTTNNPDSSDGIPPPGAPDWTPPPKQDDWVAPGQREDWTPPGKQEDWIPPGQRDDWVPPGKREDWVPPGKR